jgi:mxaA protein
MTDRTQLRAQIAAHGGGRGKRGAPARRGGHMMRTTQHATFLATSLLTCASLAHGAADVATPATQPPAPATAATAAAAAADPPPPSTAAARRAVPTTPATVDQPRPTGYFVGDLLTQRVLLQVHGRPLTPSSLPAPGRVNAWLERRQSTIVTDPALRRWLVIQYQILNAPKAVTVTTLPAWQLATKSGGTAETLKVPATFINVAPLSPPGSPEQVGTRDLRPDHTPPPIETAPIRRAIATSATGMALTLLAWLGWTLWRNRRAAATQPFARALREMRSLDDREPRAWQILHRAFDRTAGRVIQRATLPTLFERAPQLAPARSQIEEFFTQSNLLFFGSPSIPEASSLPRTLCAELRRIERRHER